MTLRVGDAVRLSPAYSWGEGRYAGWPGIIASVTDHRDHRPADGLIYDLDLGQGGLPVPAYPDDLAPVQNDQHPPADSREKPPVNRYRIAYRRPGDRNTFPTMTAINAVDEAEARTLFRQSEPNAMIETITELAPKP